MSTRIWSSIMLFTQKHFSLAQKVS